MPEGAQFDSKGHGGQSVNVIAEAECLVRRVDCVDSSRYKEQWQKRWKRERTSFIDVDGAGSSERRLKSCENDGRALNQSTAHKWVGVVGDGTTRAWNRSVMWPTRKTNQAICVFVYDTKSLPSGVVSTCICVNYGTYTLKLFKLYNLFMHLESNLYNWGQTSIEVEIRHNNKRSVVFCAQGGEQPRRNI